MRNQYDARKWMNRYPAISDLKRKCQKRMPAMAWAYLETGTDREEALLRNLRAFEKITFIPRFLKGELKPDLGTHLFGRLYAAPFGIAPVGLTGLMWPRAEAYLAETARQYQIPFCLSTVATRTPEEIGPLVGDYGWFQLYAAREEAWSFRLLDRAKAAGFHTLLVTIDIPTPSRRQRAVRAGLSVPPRLSPGMIWECIKHPRWTWHTLQSGIPRLRTLEPYRDVSHQVSVGEFVHDHFGGNLSWEYIERIRAYWKGPLILKGILHPADAEKAVRVGADGIVVSNHGGRQLDASIASLAALPAIAKAVSSDIAILFDSGVGSGLDVIRALALGADFVLLGRAFMYGLGALGRYGGLYVCEILEAEMKANLAQLGIETIAAAATLLERNKF